MQSKPAPGGAKKRALQHAERTVMSHQKTYITTNCWIEVSARSEAKESLHVRAYGDSPVFWREHHMRCLRGTRWASEDGLHNVWSSVSVGCGHVPSMGHGSGAEVNVRHPPLLK